MILWRAKRIARDEADSLFPYDANTPARRESHHVPVSFPGFIRSPEHEDGKWIVYGVDPKAITYRFQPSFKHK